jgi:hypothetical protein
MAHNLILYGACGDPDKIKDVEIFPFELIVAITYEAAYFCLSPIVALVLFYLNS